MIDRHGKHGEPWLLSELGKYLGGEEWTLVGHYKTGHPEQMLTSKNEDAAVRARACVNALEGVETEKLIEARRIRARLLHDREGYKTPQEWGAAVREWVGLMLSDEEREACDL